MQSPFPRPLPPPPTEICASLWGRAGVWGPVRGTEIRTAELRALQGSLVDLEAVLTDRSVSTAPSHSRGSVCPVDVTEQPVTRRSRPPQNPVVLLGGKVTLGGHLCSWRPHHPVRVQGLLAFVSISGGLAGIPLAAAPQDGLWVTEPRHEQGGHEQGGCAGVGNTAGTGLIGIEHPRGQSGPRSTVSVVHGQHEL